MNNENPKYDKTEDQDGEEVVSVWYGDHNTKFLRRRYFEGYTYYETLDERGKKVMHNVYTGTWYTQKLEPEERKRRRVAYVLMLVFGAALLFLGCTRYIGINSKAYGALPAFVGLFGFGWILVGLFNEFTVPTRRTIGDYRASSLGLKRGGLVAGVASGITFLLTVVFTFVDGDRTGLHLLAAGMELAASVLAFLVRHLESGVEYEQTRSEDAGKYLM